MGGRLAELWDLFQKQGDSTRNALSNKILMLRSFWSRLATATLYSTSPGFPLAPFGNFVAQTPNCWLSIVAVFQFKAPGETGRPARRTFFSLMLGMLRSAGQGSQGQHQGIGKGRGSQSCCGLIHAGLEEWSAPGKNHPRTLLGKSLTAENLRNKLTCALAGNHALRSKHTWVTSLLIHTPPSLTHPQQICRWSWAGETADILSGSSSIQKGHEKDCTQGRVTPSTRAS